MEKNTQSQASKAAVATLKKMQAACKEVTGTNNIWHQKGSDFVMDISNRVHDDGAITGRILRLGRPSQDGHRPNRLVGTIRIEGNGTITRAHSFLAQAAQQLREAREQRETQERTVAKVSPKMRVFKNIKEGEPSQFQKFALVQKKIQKVAPDRLEAARARAAHARSVKMEKLAQSYEQKLADIRSRIGKPVVPKEEPKRTTPPDQLAIKRERMAYARKIRMEKRAAKAANDNQAS